MRNYQNDRGFFLGFGRAGKHVRQFDFRVVVSRVAGSFFAVLDGFLGAPLDARQALFAPALPGRLARGHDDIFRRADFLADRATIAFLIHPEFFIHLGNLGET